MVTKLTPLPTVVHCYQTCPITCCPLLPNLPRYLMQSIVTKITPLSTSYLQICAQTSSLIRISAHHFTSNPRRCTCQAYCPCRNRLLWLRSRWIVRLLPALSSICAFMTCCSTSNMMFTSPYTSHQYSGWQRSHTLFIQTQPFVLHPFVCFGEAGIFERFFFVKGTQNSIFLFRTFSAARKTAILPRHCKAFTEHTRTGRGRADGMLFPVDVLEPKYLSHGTTLLKVTFS